MNRRNFLSKTSLGLAASSLSVPLPSAKARRLMMEQLWGMARTDIV